MLVTAASVSDNTGGTQVLSQIAKAHPRVTKAWADSGYRTKAVDHGAGLGIDVEVVHRDPAGKGFRVIPRRRVVERTFGRPMHHRGLALDYGNTPTPLGSHDQAGNGRPDRPSTHPRVHTEPARHLTVRRQSDSVGPDGDLVLCHTDLDPRPIDTFRHRWVSKIEQDRRAAHVQDSPSVFSEAQPSTKDNAATVFPQLSGASSTWPGVHRPGDVLIHRPLDMVFSPHWLRGSLPERHNGAHRRVHPDSHGLRRGGPHCLCSDQHPAIIPHTWTVPASGSVAMLTSL